MAIAKFNREDVIKKTIEIFWTHGYSATSMKMIIDGTGLKPGSIYNSFGNKEELFKESLTFYTNISLKQMCLTIDSAESIGKGICQIFYSMIEDSLKSNYSSCFLIKTQLELAKENSELFEFASSKLDDKEDVLKKYIIKCWGEYLSDDRATALMLNMFGLRVYGYGNKTTEQILQGLKQNLDWLPW